ncbi:MAG TPA: retroviral-like aspartic protease family protein [Steroidobacteraceae bacterium]
MARLGLIVLLTWLPASAWPQQATIDATLIAAPPVEAEPAIAEIKPPNFAYVAATRRDRVGRVMAPVFINDVGPFAFLVDTGASTSVIGPRVAARLKLEPVSGRTKLLRGITGSERVPTVTIDSLTAGQIELGSRDLPMVAPRVFADADGIFGVDAFAQGCLFVNFAEKRVSILETRCPRVSEQWEVLHAQMRFGGLAVVPARIGKVRVHAIIDTGAERSLGNRALLVAAGLEKKALDPDTATVVSAATSRLVPGNILKTPTFRMGSVAITNMHIVFGEFEVFRMWEVGDDPAIVLGMDVLGTTSAMMLDFTREELAILPNIAGDMLPMRRRGPATRIPRD